MLIVAAVAAVGVLVWQGIDILFLVFAGILLAVFLRALSDPLARYTPASPGWTLTIVLLLLALLIGMSAWGLGPQMVEQFEGLGEELPEVVEEVQEMLEEHPWGRQLLEAFEGEDDQAEMREWISGFFFGTLEGIAYLLAIFFISLFLAYQPALYTEGVVRLFPLQHREHVSALIDQLGSTLRWWLIGRALAMLMVGVSTTLLLVILDIPLAVLLGIIAGLLTFIPYLGPIVAAIPIGLVALLEGPTDFFWAMGLYAIIQHIEGYVIDPIIQRKVVYLPPALTVALQVFMGVLFGALGIALATPLAAVGMVIVQRSYIERTLGDYDAADEGRGKRVEAERESTEVAGDGEG